MSNTNGNMELFFELLQVALGHKEKLSHSPSNEEWAELFWESQKQAVAGVAFMAIENLDQHGQKLPLPLLYEWIGLSEQIKNQNRVLNRRCAEIGKHFSDTGFRYCILKGQGNARMYPEPQLRTCGDIDIWLEGDREKIRNYVLSLYPQAEDTEMHIEYPIYDDVPVEVHYKPRYSRISKYEKRLQEWFAKQADEQFSNKLRIEGYVFCVPTAKFNAIQQMSHMMGHFFYEGLGMRHLIDYYFVLTELHKDGVNEDFGKLFNHLGLLSFASGIMWIEKKVLGLSEDMLIVPASERRGRIILKWVEEGGNFGFYRQDREEREKSVFNRGVIEFCRLMQLIPVQPSEAFWRIRHKIGNVESMKEVLRGE